MYCDCFINHPGWMKFIFFGGIFSFLCMIAGMPFFKPLMVPFPFAWIVGILSILLTLMIPFYFLRSEMEKEGKKGKKA